MSDSEQSKISGISVGLAFIVVGLLFGYWLTDVYGSWTSLIAGSLILFGVAASLINIHDQTGGKYRFDSAGVGMICLVPSLFASHYVYQVWRGWERGITISLLALVIFVGAIGVIDFVVSVTEGSKGFKEKTIAFLKFVALIASSGAAILSGFDQIIQFFK